MLQSRIKALLRSITSIVESICASVLRRRDSLSALHSAKELMKGGIENFGVVAIRPPVLMYQLAHETDAQGRGGGMCFVDRNSLA
jgi:hypothetical protein